MSTSDATLSLTLKAKNLAGKEVDKLHGSLGKLGAGAKSAGGALKTFGMVGVAGIALVAAAAVAAVPKLMGMAAKLQQMDAKATTVFGDQKGLVESWAKTNAAAMGLTSREAVGLSASFADLLIPMGFTRKAAAEMSTKVVGLSGALAQWTGGQYDASQVADILSKAMLGERDGLKALGISISEADVSARLLKNGTNELTGAALEQAKALATQQLIFEKSTDAQAAYAAGGDTLLGKQALLGAKFSEVTESIVAGLTPALTDIMAFVMDVAVPAAEDFIGKLRAWVDQNQPLINQIKGALVDSLNTLIEKVSAVVTFIVSVATAITSNKSAMESLGTIFGTIAAFADELWQLIDKVVGGIADFVDKVSKDEGAMMVLGAVFGYINDQIQDTVQFLRDLIRITGQALDALAELSQDRGPSPLVGLPGFAHGGWAGLSGPEAIIVGEQGPEFIVPNGGTAPGGMGGVPAVVVLQLDGREVARVVDERLFYRRQLSPT